MGIQKWTLLFNDEDLFLKDVVETIRKNRPGVLIQQPEDASITYQDTENNGNKRVSIVTFGKFAVFIDGKILHFRYSKSEELFALLVDMRGRYLHKGQARKALWPEEDGSVNHHSYLSMIKKEMINVFSEKGINDIFREQDAQMALITENVKCDLYDYIENRNSPLKFTGNYMEKYAWSENTVGVLTEIEKKRNESRA